MSKKGLSGIQKPPSQYIIITNPDGGHTGQTSGYITLREAKKILQDESVCVYIFKIPKICYCGNFLLKYPLSEFYSCLEINELIDEMNFFNIENKNKIKKNKENDFLEYIELKSLYNNSNGEHEIQIIYP